MAEVEDMVPLDPTASHLSLEVDPCNGLVTDQLLASSHTDDALAGKVAL